MLVFEDFFDLILGQGVRILIFSLKILFISSPLKSFSISLYLFIIKIPFLSQIHFLLKFSLKHFFIKNIKNGFPILLRRASSLATACPKGNIDRLPYKVIPKQSSIPKYQHQAHI